MGMVRGFDCYALLQKGLEFALYWTLGVLITKKDFKLNSQLEVSE